MTRLSVTLNKVMGEKEAAERSLGEERVRRSRVDADMVGEGHLRSLCCCVLKSSVALVITELSITYILLLVLIIILRHYLAC